MSTFSDTGSLRITSGAIQATVPANDILVLLSLSSLDVPKSEIFTASLWVTNTLKRGQTEIVDECLVIFYPRNKRIGKRQILLFINNAVCVYNIPVHKLNVSLSRARFRFDKQDQLFANFA